jgi:hypothetical protein
MFNDRSGCGTDRPHIQQRDWTWRAGRTGFPWKHHYTAPWKPRRRERSIVVLLNKTLTPRRYRIGRELQHSKVETDGLGTLKINYKIAEQKFALSVY